MTLTIEQKKALIEEALKVETKAAMDTQEVGGGKEYVDVGMASTILEKVRDAQTVFSKLPVPFAMPTSSWVIPVEGGDPTFYATGENTNGPGTEYENSNAGTASIQLDAKKYTAMTYISGELDEDSIISIRPLIETKLAKAYTELLDKVILNSDTITASTGNVNSDDGAPASGSYYLHADGVRKIAIANSKTVNVGTLTLSAFRDARKMMGLKGLDPSKLLFVLNPDTYYKLLSLTQVETVEKFGAAATVVNGVIKYIDGIEIVPTSALGNTEADGKQSVTAGNNTLGTGCLIYKEDIITGFKRDLQTFVEYLPNLDQFRITAHTRFALKINGTDGVVVLRNITV